MLLWQIFHLNGLLRQHEEKLSRIHHQIISTGWIQFWMSDAAAAAAAAAAVNAAAVAAVNASAILAGAVALASQNEATEWQEILIFGITTNCSNRIVWPKCSVENFGLRKKNRTNRREKNSGVVPGWSEFRRIFSFSKFFVVLACH